MKKGSTAWYNHMAQQLNTCSMTMMLERYNRLLTAAKKSQPRLDEWMADQYTRVWNADYWLNKPPRRPIIIASLHDAETIRAHATNHPLTTGGIDIIPFPHMEDGKMIFHMADGSMLNAWPDCKNFADLPIAMSKTRIMDREEFRREYPHESAWKTPAPGTIKTAEENRVKRQSDAYMKMMSLLSGNIPAEQKTFEDKVYYIGKYRRFIQVKSRDQDNLICGGLTQYLDDSKTDISRQKISIKKFRISARLNWMKQSCTCTGHSWLVKRWKRIRVT
jgi:hypothetical protein